MININMNTRSQKINNKNLNIVIYDLETTGLDINKDRIVEISIYL